MANRIAFINGKGGCGKTTSIFHVSGVLSKRGDKVLVIDLDKQRNTTSTFLMNTTIPDSTVLDFMLGKAEAEDVTAKALFQSRGNANPKYYGVDVMGSDVRLQDESWLAKVDGEKMKERLDEFVQSQGYDWVLVDMPPSNLSLNDICFKYIVSHVIVPFSSDVFSVNGYGDIMNIIADARKKNPDLTVLGVYLSRYNKQSSLDQYIRQQLLNYDTFIDVQIPSASDVREAVMFGRPISYYKQSSNSRTAYEALVNEMDKRVLI